MQISMDLRDAATDQRLSLACGPDLEHYAPLPVSVALARPLPLFFVRPGIEPASLSVDFAATIPDQPHCPSQKYAPFLLRRAVVAQRQLRSLG